MKIEIPIVKTIFLTIYLNEAIISQAGNNFLFKSFGILFLLFSGILLVHYAFKHINEVNVTNLYFKVLLLLLFIWSLFTITRSLNTNQEGLITLIGHNQVGGWAWLTPLAIFFGLTILNWTILFEFFIKFLLLGLLLSIIYLFTSADYSLITLLSVYPVLLLTYNYYEKFEKKVIILSAFVYVYFAFFILDSRSSLIIFSLYLAFLIIEYLRNKNLHIYKKTIFILLFSIGIVLLSIQANSIFKSVSSVDGMETDTRTFLFTELFSDMEEGEQLVGRGALGKYYSPYFNGLKEQGITGGDAAYRSSSEIGYLHMILKGGYVMMLLYLLILLPAAYLGIFKSKNRLARMAGYYILNYLIMFLLIHPPEYRLGFLILWMAVGTVISKPFRELSDRDVEEFIIERRYVE